MLELKDFFHLPEVDTLVEQLAGDRPGLVVVAGLDPRPALALPGAGEFLPSGRSTVFGILVRQVLAAHPQDRVIVVAENRDAVRVPGSYHGRVRLAPIKPPASRAEQSRLAAGQRPGVLIIDQLDAATVPAALEAAQRGILVLSQLDCVFFGAGIARHLADLGASRDLLTALTWVVGVQRLPTLCPHCRQPARLDSARHAELALRYPGLSLDGRFWRAGSCDQCGGTGHSGEVTAFDFFRAAAGMSDLFEQPSLLAMEKYVLRLALSGQVSLELVTHFDSDQLHRTYHLLSASETALAAANTELRQRLAELESANRVLRQRTESLISLQSIAQTLIASIELEGLASRLNKHVRNLCGADRSVLYVLRPDGRAEILAVSGWESRLVHTSLDALDVFGATHQETATGDGGPVPFPRWPPGIPPRHPDVEGADLRAGLRVPLIAQNEVVGLLVVHSTRKAAFSAGETALLQAAANQGAVAIQRAGLITALKDKISQLEAAQAELIQKERLDRELELAHEVQQSLLPRDFPRRPGYAFAARNQTARRVGGDFYDAFALDERRIGLVMADVSDKGMPAALFMALTRSLLLAEARREPSPSAALASVHHLLLELGNPGMFVTVVYGVLDTAEAVFTYTRAGHEEPLLVREDETTPLHGQGTFLGFLDLGQDALSEEVVRLQPGDRLVLFTDGVTDALSPAQQPFGLDRLKGLLRAHARLTADELCAVIFAELAEHQAGAEPYDDMAVLIVAVH